MARRDIIVVGAGASGMAAAIAAGMGGARVRLLEALPKAGRSVMASGNGRCNFANADLAPQRYNAPAFVAQTMGADPLRPVLDLFESLGLWYVADDEGRLFPRSRAAASVLDALLAGLDEQGVELALESRVERLRPAGTGWRVGLADGAELGCDALVWAAGGGSAGGPARAAGLPRAPERPALCPLACAPKPPRALDGVRVQCAVELRDERGTRVERQEGEVLFRPYGLSGIVVFDLSRLARKGDVLALDLVPDVGERELALLLERRAERFAQRLSRPGGALGFLDGALHPKLARCVMERACGRDGRGRLDARALVRLLKGWEFSVEDAADKGQAQVTQGGLDLAAFDAATLAAKGVPGLYACGEALDVDGACGGFNLAWAWSSGMVAGTSAARG